MRTASRPHQQLTAFGSFPEWFRYKCVSNGPVYPAASRTVAGSRNQPAAHSSTVSGNRMKLTKKQLSAGYVTQATASKSLKEQAYRGGFTKGDVANHRDSRLDCSSVASPQGTVEFTPHVSFCITSRERVWNPYQAFTQVHTPTGLRKHSQLRERHPSCNVEEGPQSVMLMGYLLRKWQGGVTMAANGEGGYLMTSIS
jgi:hypothetical protein